MKIKNSILIAFIFNFALSSAFAQSISYQEVQNTPFMPVFESSIAFADVDNDNDYDLLVTGRDTNMSHISRLYLNNGSGGFSLDTINSFAGTSNSSVAFADIDMDNDMDLMITGQNSGSPLVIISRMYRNNGSGGFSQISNTPFSAVQNSSIAFADIDGNQTKDLILTGDGGGSNYLAEVYRSDSSGNFSLDTNSAITGLRYSSIALADVDNDNDKDLLVSGLGFLNPGTSHTAKLYLNNGSGTFTEKIGTPFVGVSYSSVAFADVDGDSDQDIFISGGSSGSGKSSTLYLNDSLGNYSISNQVFTDVNKAAIAFADVDGDNDMDLLISGESATSGRITELYENDGLGGFSMVQGMPFDGVGNGSIAFADVNGDQLADLVISGEKAGNTFITKLYLNTSVVSRLKEFTSEKDHLIKVYPNPTETEFTLEVDQSIVGQEASFVIYNSIGELIQERTYHQLPKRIDLESLPNGVLFLSLNLEGSTITKKLIKH
jgi:hypothetical protein